MKAKLNGYSDKVPLLEEPNYLSPPGPVQLFGPANKAGLGLALGKPIDAAGFAHSPVFGLKGPNLASRPGFSAGAVYRASCSGQDSVPIY